MNVLDSQVIRPIALILAVFLLSPSGAMAAGPTLWLQQQAGSTGAPQGQQAPVSGSTGGSANTTTGTRPPAGSTSTPDIDAPVPSQQTSTAQSTSAVQNGQTVPSGTAAAPYEKQEGVSASKPAGAAIAPAKQRHIHSFSIRAGLLVGAAVAIGVITAVSLASPSRAQNQ